MDWNKAKNLILFLLLGLNVCLAILVYVNRPKYELTTQREEAIRQVLAQNRITLRADVPKSYKPMAQILLNPPDYDREALIALFFGEADDVTRTTEFNKTIFTGARGGTLTFTADEVIFEDEKGSGPLDFTRAVAKELCDGVIQQNNRLLPGYALDGPRGTETRTGYRLDYRQTYKKRLIYANYAAFTLTENGIVRIEFTYKKPIGFEKEKREIISPDEALFALMQRLLNMYENKESVITGMDVVYYQEEAVEDGVQALVAVPGYRFWVEGVNAPFIMNAYTGVIV